MSKPDRDLNKFDCFQREPAENYLREESAEPETRARDEAMQLMRGLEVDHIKLELQNTDLGAGQDRFYTVFQHVPTVAVQGYAMDGTTLYWNDASEKIYGYTAQEAVGQNLLDLIIPPEMQDGVRQAIQGMAETGQPIPASELNLMRKDGSRVAVYSSHAIVSNPGHASELFCLDVDLSERKQIETALRESEARMHALVESTDDIIVLQDTDGRYLYYNGVAAYGMSVQDLVGKLPEDVFDEATATRIIQAVKRVVTTGQTVRSENKLLWNDTEMWFNDCNYPVRDAAGQIVAVGTISRNITPQKQAETLLRTTLQRFDTLISSLYAGVLVVAEDGRVEYVNQAFCDLFDLTDTPASLRGLTSEDRVAKFNAAYAMPDAANQRIREIHAHGQPVRGEEVAMSGGRLYLRDFIPIMIDGERHGRLWFFQDITVRKQMEEALRESETLQRALLANLPAGVVIIDPVTRIIETVNNAASTMFGAPGEQIIGHRCHTFLCPAMEGACPICDLGMQVDNAERVMLCADGSRCSVLKSVKRIHIRGKEKLLECFVDISARKHAEDELLRTKNSLAMTNKELQLALAREQKLARTDPLTGVGNRLSFFEIAEHEFIVAKRYVHPLTVIMLDLDHFKQVNDTFGHDIGDQVLVQVAQTIHMQLRAPDLLARFGGEEFIVLLSMTDIPQAQVVAERIRDQIDELVVETKRGAVRVTASIGVADFDRDDASIDMVIQRADQALYAAKQTGRNCVVSIPTNKS
jgi:diguanylate cyclase (GGDEF)-like protein/PAS domain S-box-containing protein